MNTEEKYIIKRTDNGLKKSIWEIINNPEWFYKNFYIPGVSSIEEVEEMMKDGHLWVNYEIDDIHSYLMSNEVEALDNEELEKHIWWFQKMFENGLMFEVFIIDTVNIVEIRADHTFNVITTEMHHRLTEMAMRAREEQNKIEQTN